MEHDRQNGSDRRRACRRSWASESAAAGSAPVDPQLWLQLAQGDVGQPSFEVPWADHPAGSGLAPRATPPDGQRNVSLGRAERAADRLLRVLDDDQLSMAPPTAAGLTDDQWTALPDADRKVLVRRQLAKLDPRLLARAISRRSMSIVTSGDRRG